MFNTIAMNSLSAIEFIPIFIWKLFSIEAWTHIRISHFRCWSIHSRKSFVISFEIFFHPFFIKYLFARFHYTHIKSEILKSQTSTQHYTYSKFFRTKFKWFKVLLFLFCCIIQLRIQGTCTDFNLLMWQ